jgi:hypothetical protein
MKQILHRVSSVLLAIIVLFSTFSFTVDSHYCGETLVDFSVFSKAKSCSGNMMNSDSDELEFVKKSCCKNVTSIFEGEDIEQQVLKKIDLKQVYFAVSYIISNNNLLFETSQKATATYYYPPIIDQDKVILFENFII